MTTAKNPAKSELKNPSSKGLKKGESGQEFDEKQIRGDSLRGAGTSADAVNKSQEAVVENGSSGRERLKRHRVEVAGRVWVPEMWGKEDLLKDWIDCTKFDAAVMSSSVVSARASLVEEGRRANSTTLRIKNRC